MINSLCAQHDQRAYIVTAFILFEHDVVDEDTNYSLSSIDINSMKMNLFSVNAIISMH